MQRYQWSQLNKQQLGRFYEQYVQMELAMYGFELYPPAVDDHGVDLVARWHRDPFFEIQVKSIRKPEYLFLRKKHFHPSPSLYLAVGLHLDGKEPVSLLLPSQVWHEDKSQDNLLSQVLCENDYLEKKSDPEYGMRLTADRFEQLRQRFDLQTTLSGIATPKIDAHFLRTVFCDDFLFGNKPLTHLEKSSLPAAQSNLAMAIHSSTLYPERINDVAQTLEQLNPLFAFQDNSEGPMIFASKVMYLMERYGEDMPWFVQLWSTK